MAAVTHSAEEATDSLQKLTLDPLAKPAEAPDTKKQPSSTRVGNDESSDQIAGAPGPVLSADQSSTSGTQYMTEANMFPAQNTYAPNTYYYGGHESLVAEWEEYPRYVNIDGMEIQSPTVYSENGSVLYHPGYTYASQMPYGPYSPAGPPLTTIRADGQLYGPQHFHYQGPFYQHPVPPGVQFMSPPTSMSQGDLSASVGADQTIFAGDGSNANFVNGMTMSPRPGHPMAHYGSFGRGAGVLPVPITSIGYQDSRHGYDGTRPSSSWTDTTRAFDGQQRHASSAVPSVISQPTPALGPFGQNIRPVPHMTGAQQPRAPSGIGPAPATLNRVYSPNRIYPQVHNVGRSSPGLGGSGRTWIAVDRNKPRGRGNGSLCNCIGTLDVLNEQNRGPRTARFRNQSMASAAIQAKEHSLTANGNNEINDVAADRELYNRPDFVVNYKDAKFFIIKSYSEDNIHKSIKYGVWASTPNGNKKLDAAYKEAQEKSGVCPVFLFFSVNASGQFCGIAEMVGLVDFQTSVDYWQQDKWSGQFRVKWQIIKDVPNSQFRHIILENNDNKPVTNSRDTQEVKFEQGKEILNIFKNYVCKTSILDDFPFYEARQSAMQEKRVRQEVSYQAGAVHGQDKYVRASVGKTAEDKDDIKTSCTQTELISASPSSISVLSGEGGVNKSSQRLLLEESMDTLNLGDTLKSTTDKDAATQVEAGDEKAELND